MQFRTFKAASTASRLTTAAKTVIQRAVEQIPSPTLDTLRAAIGAVRGRPTDDRAARMTANMTPPSPIGPAPAQPKSPPVAAPPDMGAAIRAARKGKR